VHSESLFPSCVSRRDFFITKKLEIISSLNLVCDKLGNEVTDCNKSSDANKETNNRFSHKFPMRLSASLQSFEAVFDTWGLSPRLALLELLFSSNFLLPPPFLEHMKPLFWSSHILFVFWGLLFYLLVNI